RVLSAIMTLLNSTRMRRGVGSKMIGGMATNRAVVCEDYRLTPHRQVANPKPPAARATHSAQSASDAPADIPAFDRRIRWSGSPIAARSRLPRPERSGRGHDQA